MKKFAVMPLNDYIEACNVIRDKTNKMSAIKSGDLAKEIDMLPTADSLSILKSSKYMNANVKTFGAIKLDDVSFIKHELTIHLKNMQNGDDNMLNLNMTGGENGVTYTPGATEQNIECLILNGTPTSDAFIQFDIPTFEVGKKYYFGLLYGNSTPSQHPILCGFMVLNSSTGNYEPTLEMVYDPNKFGGILFNINGIGKDYTSCQIVPVVSTEYVGIGAESWVDLSTVSVSRYGKNLFDMSQVNHPKLIYNDDNSITIVGGIYGVYTGKTLKEYCPLLKVGDVCTLSAVSNGAQFIRLHEASIAWNFGKTNTITQAMLNSKVYLYGISSTDPNAGTDIIIKNIQLELGTTATYFEPYIEPQTVKANADGTVEGLTSLHPNMTIISDTENVVIECNYLRDIDTYIDNLMMNIALTGGE